MNQQYRDILTIIERHGPITTGDICEKLTTLGYGGAMSWQVFRDSVAKQLCYLRDKGEVTGEDKPQTKGKPLRYWSLAKSEEMASDVVEVEIPTFKDSLTVDSVAEESSVAKVTDEAKWEAFKEAYKDTGILMEDASKTVTPEPTVSVEVKAEVKLTPISVGDAMDAWFATYKSTSWLDFCAGIRFAEKHHGITS